MAFNEENAAEITVEVFGVQLDEEDRNKVEERLGVDRRQDIVKRLKAISDSVSFHSEFVQKFMEKCIIAKEQDGVTVFKFVKKSETTENGDNKQEQEPDNEREDSSDAENSNDIIQDSTENKIPDVCSSENCTDGTVTASDFQENVKNPKPTLEIDDVENSANHVPKEVERRLKLINVQYSFDCNLGTMVYYSVGKFNIAKIRNEGLLLAMPDNFNALWNKVKLMIAMANDSSDCIDERAEEILNRLEQTVSHNGEQMLIAKAEIATMYVVLPIASESLIRCIRLYEEVLAETNLLKHNDCAERLPEKLLIFWKCYLVRAYAMLTNANKKLLAEYGYNHNEALSRVEELVLAVDSSEFIANRLKAEIWVNLANTFEHFRQYYPSDGFRRDVCSGLSLVDLFAYARKYDPDNPRILMRSGRELRQRATSEQELTEAIDFLERALVCEDIEDIRDIIYHHIGLAYKALWIRTEHPICEEIIEKSYTFSRDNLLPRTPPLGCRVIKPPDLALDFNLIPAPYKKTPRSAFWKILIPIAHDPEHPYLLKAIKYFEEVTHTLYLLDIARTYSSTQNVEKAREYFQKTLNRERSESVDVDFVGVSLFENLAHFEECEMIRKAFKDFEPKYIQDTLRNEDSYSAVTQDFVDVSLHANFEESEMIREAFSNSESEKVKSLYREAIRFSTISRQKPTVAFHYTLRILYKQLALSVGNPLPEMDQMILQNEYFLLYMAIQEAKGSNEIVNSIATDDFRIALMWRLIEMFNQRNQEYDAAAAFTYLSILVMAKKLTTEVKGINFTAIEKQRMLLQAAERVAQQRVSVAETRFLLPQYKELCDLQSTDQENASVGYEPLTDLEIAKLGIVNNIMQPEFDPGYLRSREQC